MEPDRSSTFLLSEWFGLSYLITYICVVETNIIDKFVRVVNVHYMDHTVSTMYNYSVKIEVEFLSPTMYVNNHNTIMIRVYDNFSVLQEEVYNSFFGLHKYCGVPTSDLLEWVLSKVEFDKVWNKKGYERLISQYIVTRVFAKDMHPLVQ